MKVGNYHFVPTLWPSLLFVVLLPLFISLGVWQLNRAAEKQTILASLENKKSAVAKNIVSIDIEADENSRVSLSGTILSTQQFLLDNKVYKSVAGYEVLTPVKLNGDGRVVLLSRGWVGQGGSRNDLPNVSLDVVAVTDVTGLFVRPSKGYTIGDALDENSHTWPRVIQFLDYAQIGSALGEEVLEGVVQLDAPIGTAYPRVWKPIAFGPEKHYGYALQWFAIALVLLVLYIVLNTKKKKHTK